VSANESQAHWLMLHRGRTSGGDVMNGRVTGEAGGDVVNWGG